jgi:peptidoglycan/xylan/chitin deacetylase (PgdA/CDA1 family)
VVKRAPRRVASLVPPANAPARSIRVPVLTYHRVNPLRAGANAVETDLTIEPRDFQAQIEALASAGYRSITQEQLFGALYRGRPLPPKPVMLTVDDGYVDDVRNILPVLRRAGMKATFFIITDRFREPGFMSPDQIRELDRAGMDIGDHSHTHTDLTALSGEALRAEVAGSRRRLERVLGHRVWAFCYPSGRHDDAVAQAVRDAGYTFAYTTEGGDVASTDGRLTIPRFHVGRGTSPQTLLSLIA